MCWLTASSYGVNDLAVECDEADSILLFDDDIADCGCDVLGVFELRKRDSLRALLHRLTHIEQHLADEVGFLFKLFHEDSIGSTVNLPIDVPEIVAGCVLAMLGEFGCEPLKRAAM